MTKILAVSLSRVPAADEMETDEIVPSSRVTAADVESKVQLAVSRVTGAVESIALVQYSQRTSGGLAA
jgi:hypothetical protein